jgi:hypothetical protein
VRRGGGRRVFEYGSGDRLSATERVLDKLEDS